MESVDLEKVYNLQSLLYKKCFEEVVVGVELTPFAQTAYPAPRQSMFHTRATCPSIVSFATRSVQKTYAELVAGSISEYNFCQRCCKALRKRISSLETLKDYFNAFEEVLDGASLGRFYSAAADMLLDFAFTPLNDSGFSPRARAMQRLYQEDVATQRLHTDVVVEYMYKWYFDFFLAQFGLVQDAGTLYFTYAARFGEPGYKKHGVKVLLTNREVNVYVAPENTVKGMPLSLSQIFPSFHHPNREKVMEMAFTLLNDGVGEVEAFKTALALELK